MWPWAHVAAAYLLLSGLIWVRSRRHPTGAAAIAVGLGALLPDLIDKPLAWRLAVLPYGRTLAHSLLIAGAALVVAWVVARRYDRRRVYAAFALGYLVHLAGDGYQAVLNGNWADLFFLVWPLAAAPESGEIVGVVPQLLAIEPTPFFLIEVAITTGGVVLWWYQGRPGVSTMRRWVARTVRR